MKTSSQTTYRQSFTQFARDASLENYTRRQLAGKTGRKLLLAHFGSVSVTILHVRHSQLKAVWELGLGLSWPINPKRDLRRAQSRRRGRNPPDEIVRTWAEAMAREADPYLRLLWLLLAQYGWRPGSHVGHLKWRNVRFEAEVPVAVYADGRDEDFKTNAPVLAHVFPDVREALVAWAKSGPGIASDRPILPRRTVTGKVAAARSMTADGVRDWLLRARKKWGLPPLLPKDLRHWVATQTRKAGLSKQASAFLMGHDPTQGGSMRDWYDNPPEDAILDEQMQALPDGPLGLLTPPTVEIVQGIPEDAAELVRTYFAGEIGTMDFATRMETVRLKAGTPFIQER
jgi:integrase